MLADDEFIMISATPPEVWSADGGIATRERVATLEECKEYYARVEDWATPRLVVEVTLDTKKPQT